MFALLSNTMSYCKVRSGIKIERDAQVKKFHVPRDNDRAPIVLDLEAKGGGERSKGEATSLNCDM